MTAKIEETNTEAAERKKKLRVRLPVMVEYDGEPLDEVWMRRPVVLDGIVAGKQEGNNAILLSLIAQCIGVDLDWLWDQPAEIANKLLKAYGDDLKDPVHLPEWDGLTLTLFKPLSIQGKEITKVTLAPVTIKDLMNDAGEERMYELVARLIGLKVSDIRDMDYLHDYSELVAKVNSFR